MPGEFRLPPGRVLIVDDGKPNRQLIQLILKKAGCTVDEAENGRVGVEKVLANDYAVVLMDIQMPVMDGYEATTLLRKRGYTKPVIALTANAMREDEEKCRQSGFSAFLPKPVNIDQLIETMALWMPKEESVQSENVDSTVAPRPIAKTEIGHATIEVASPARTACPTLVVNEDSENDSASEAIQPDFQLVLLRSLEAIEPAAVSSDWNALAKAASVLEAAATEHGRGVIAQSLRPLIELCERDENDHELIRHSLSNFLTISSVYRKQTDAQVVESASRESETNINENRLRKSEPTVSTADVDGLAVSGPSPTLRVTEPTIPQAELRLPQSTIAFNETEIAGAEAAGIQNGVPVTPANLRKPEPTIQVDFSEQEEPVEADLGSGESLHSAPAPAPAPTPASPSPTPEAQTPEARVDFVAKLQEGLVGFQEAWDAGDNFALINTAKRLQVECDLAEKTEISASLDRLVDAAIAEDDAGYKHAVKSFLDVCRSEFTATVSFKPAEPKKRPKLRHLERLSDAQEPIVSALPTDDEAFRQIAIDFVPQLEGKLREFDAACQQGDMEQIAVLAHWLKGAGGTCGFDHFTIPSTELESAAKAGESKRCEECIDLLWWMGGQIVVESAPATLL